MKKKIILTGGGSAGHVMVNLALIPELMRVGWEISYIGSRNGIEKELIANTIQYDSISTGKLRRYFDLKNFKDPFRVIKGIFQSKRIIKKQKPDVIFSKGGFVSVPVVLGARLCKVPVIIHESDITPGLANQISLPFATKICTTFPETGGKLPSHKVVHVGAVIRNELKKGNATRGLSFCYFVRQKPVLLVMGGSLGAKKINEIIRRNLDALLADFQIVHICGQGQTDPTLQKRGYCQFEYIKDELPDILAMADIVVSRAGANAIFEFLALRKPMLLIPLPAGQSRGDQILNAKSFQKSGYANWLHQENLTDTAFIQEICKLYKQKDQYIERMRENEDQDAVEKVMHIIEKVAKSS